MNREVLRLRIFLLVLVSMMVLATTGFVFLEGLSPIDALYFSVATVTTVGYGDIVPRTPAGKVLAMVLIVTGVGTFLGVVANATEMLLTRREKKLRMEKIHMVIGVFFSEAGTRLLTLFTGYDPNIEGVRDELVITGDWVDKDFLRLCRDLEGHAFGVDIGRVELSELRDFIQTKSDLLLRIFENPNLLEHETFTDLLRALLHLKEELLSREDFSSLPESDRRHLAGDIKRVYELLVVEWVSYMRYLKGNFPYLYSLAMRRNPFDSEASPVVRK